MARAESMLPEKDGSGVRYKPIKRFVDIVGSLVLLVLFSPLFLMIAILIKLNSTGPVFYCRRLIGHQGKPFVALKFRSMVSNAHEILQHDPILLQEYRRRLKVAADYRVTRIGRILRKTSLDELPQLLNVLRGDMSLVGPRMLGDIELERYGCYKEKVLSVKPGITGLWQVSGRHAVSFERRIQLDLEYVEHWNLLLDFKILLMTMPAVLTGKGAG